MYIKKHIVGIFDISYAGEASILLLYGTKNIGKTLTQLIMHYGQGATSLKHDLLLSGGNQTTSGTST